MFWALNIYIVYRGMDLLRKVENWAAPFVLVMAVALMIWALWRAKGIGAVMEEKGKFNSLSEFMPIFIPSLTAMIGYWATLSLNMPDFTRFGRSQREQMIGQTVALPTTMTVFAARLFDVSTGHSTELGKRIISAAAASGDPTKTMFPFPMTGPSAVAIFCKSSTRISPFA